MTKLKRLLDEPGSDLDRVLLESGLDEAPPARSLDRTLAAIGVGGALTLGASATTTATAALAKGGAATGVGVGASQAGAGAALLVKSGGGLAKSGGLLGLSVGKWIGGALIAAGTIGGYVGLRETNDAVVTDAQRGPAPLVIDGAERSQNADRAAAAGADEALAQVPVKPDPEPAPGQRLQGAAADGGQRPDPGTTPHADDPASTPPASKPRATGEVRSPAPEKAAAQGKPSAAGKPSAQSNAAEGKPSAKSNAKTQPSTAAAGEPVSGTGLGAEIALLDGARKALAANDFDGCLARLATYSSRFPKGQMAQDAAGIRASALKKKEAAASPP